MNKNINIILFAALALFGFSNISNAQTKSFDGPYVALSVGETRNDTIKHSGNYYSDARGSLDDVTGESKDINDRTRSIKAGYNTRVGASNTILGVELGYTHLNATINSSSDVYQNAGYSGGIDSTLKVGNYTTFVARAGQVLGDKSLVSVNAGVARSKISQSHVRLSGDGHNSNESSSVETGYVLGAGYEYKLTSNLSLRADYEYVNFGDVARTTINDANGVLNDTHKVKFDNISVGVAYSF